MIIFYFLIYLALFIAVSFTLAILYYEYWDYVVVFVFHDKFLKLAHYFNYPTDWRSLIRVKHIHSIYWIDKAKPFIPELKLLRIHSISIINAGLTKIPDLSFFPHLVMLDLPFNQITEFNQDLFSDKRYLSVNLSYNQIQHLNLNFVKDFQNPQHYRDFHKYKLNLLHNNFKTTDFMKEDLCNPAFALAINEVILWNSDEQLDAKIKFCNFYNIMYKKIYDNKLTRAFYD